MGSIEFEVTFYVDKADLDKYQEEDFEREFKNCFFSSSTAENDSTSEIVAGELCSLYSSEGGAPSIDSLDVNDFKINLETLKGEFIITFQIHRIFGCSDIDTHESDYFEFNFLVDLQNQNFVCSSENMIVSFSPE